MRPCGHGDYTLEALAPTLRERAEGARWSVTPTPHGYRSPRIPVETESRDGTSFMTWWKPNWRDIWGLMRGHFIRVSVNYSLYGPLDIDVVKHVGETPSRRLDW